MTNTDNILGLELHRTRIIETTVEKRVDNKTFPSQSRSNGRQSAKDKKIQTQDPFTCANRHNQEQASLFIPGDF